MGHLTTLATCSLNQWAMDFIGNQKNIIESIRQAKAKGASLRIGPELEITGYGCLDHFLESDTLLHTWESLAEIIVHPDCQDILLDIGLPVRHRDVVYNCRCIVYNGRILLIRPKMSLANDSNYYEARYFVPWKGSRIVEDFYLPRMIEKLHGQRKCRIGDAVISTRDTCLGTETCEELWTPHNPGINYGLDGVEILSNSSGSHWELRKLHTRVELIRGATTKAGGVYLFANQIGCDGERMYYDGCAMIVVNGNIVAQGSQFSLHQVEVVTATVDLEEVRTYRNFKSRNMQAINQPSFERIEVDISLSDDAEDVDPSIAPTQEIEVKYHLPEEEISLGPACWMWDFLRRSRQAGFFLPLSGGVDSCATALIVHQMTRLVFKAVTEDKDPQAISDMLRVCGEPSTSTWRPTCPQDIATRMFHTTYMGMKENSSPDTRKRAADLAATIGSYHIDLDIDTVYHALVTLFTTVTTFVPKYSMYGGTPATNLALQNIQARLRMVMAYLLAQLLPTVRQRNAKNPENSNPGSLLVLGSANVDESLRGYLTKYDCSSADINPIGGISKIDLKRFILWADASFDMPLLKSFVSAPPTAELLPITEAYVQDDETDMGVTYAELSTYGTLRRVERLGPWGMWSKLLHQWSDKLSPRDIYIKVRFFFYNYGINRHKLTTLTPSVHAVNYGVDDNRYDMRQFLYPSMDWAYRKIERRLEAMGERAEVVADTDRRKTHTL
ncbi:Glutamine-dependent NAD(+) synthetase [Lachnellula subtilissima]|uniref:Glutamine-dependent NAD(+) synthetase n=1 Tax=Lachnellula subtilissima TaxID=602034 RepID=A0A8H8U7Z5_9HELO|nr:Glutamine-dependent NAD(+) synthetase [Lachnellula subtilissima]